MPHHPGERTYNFIDLTGRVLAGVQVLERVPAKSGAAWTVRHRCGHTRVFKTSRIRENEKFGRELRCTLCPKGKTSGTHL